MSQNPRVKPTSKPTLTQRLLLRAHSPTTAAAIHSSKFQHKPLRLLSTEQSSTFNKSGIISTVSSDVRTLRRQHRLIKAAADRERRRQKGKGRGPNSTAKPKPLSAAEKRKLGVYDIPKQEAKQWEVYKGLNNLWCDYIRDILGVGRTAANGGVTREVYVTPQNAGAVLASADFHGAEIKVARSRCVGRVGVSGIVVRDTKFTFVVVTKDGEVKTLPKEHTIFRFEIPFLGNNQETTVEHTDELDTGSTPQLKSAGEQKQQYLVFELHGEQFKNRAAPDRAKKQFKMHIPADL